MDFLARLIGAKPIKPAQKSSTNDPDVRLAKFKRLYHTVLSLCNRPRDLSSEAPLLTQLHGCLERIAALLREETRAPSPHLCLQFSAVNRIYTVITRAATASQDERVVQATVAMLAALVDSEEEDFLTNAIFAKSLMRLVRSVVDSGSVLITIETESAILELLFTITARIRLQPDILPFWFNYTSKAELDDDVFTQREKTFGGYTQKDDFPLCYILIERVHYDGRIGDFARTGLLYVFEATGRSHALEEWVVSSDLPTLLASGLGALYSQLSRELSILHPDVTLPAVLAMSDYSTTHLRATAVSAFSDKHKNHMATFLSYLAFWQDLLDHCRSIDVKHTLLDHFQILFLQQLLYPSLLQSSNTDAGSSVAVLTYITAVLESVEYRDLTSMILNYLFATQAGPPHMPSKSAAAEAEPPRSPNAIRKRESLVLLTTPIDPDDAVEPALFNLTDLILSNVTSRNSQAVFAALRLASTILTRQKSFAFGTLLEIQREDGDITRTIGALEQETERYCALATAIHDHAGIEDAYSALAEDARTAVEAQATFTTPATLTAEKDDAQLVPRLVVSPDDAFLKASMALLRTFFTNSVDVNLALTETIVSIASSAELCLDTWFALDPARYTFRETPADPSRLWVSHLNEVDATSLQAFQRCSQRPIWSQEHEPRLFSILDALVREFEGVRKSVPNIDHFIAVRKTMLQATGLDTPLTSSGPPSSVNSPARASFLDVPAASGSFSLDAGRNQAINPAASSPHTGSLSASPQPAPRESNASRATTSISMPTPAEAPNTTDLLIQTVAFAPHGGEESERRATLNHVLTNVVILQAFMLEFAALLQVRGALLGGKEVKFV